MMTGLSTLKLFGSTVAVLALSACATSNENLMPQQAIASAESNLQLAEQAGASEYSGLELDQARQKLQQARAALEDDEPESAVRLAEKSSADAELAVAQSQVARSEAAVAEIRETIQSLRQEALRGD